MTTDETILDAATLVDDGARAERRLLEAEARAEKLLRRAMGRLADAERDAQRSTQRLVKEQRRAREALAELEAAQLARSLGPEATMAGSPPKVESEGSTGDAPGGARVVKP